MEVTLVDREKVWRRRGQPRREIPQAVRELADRTYRTGKVAEVTVAPDQEEEAAELCRMLRSYATANDRRIRIQRDGDRLFFELADRPAARRRTAGDAT